MDDDVAAFLRRHPPFDSLGAAAVAEVARAAVEHEARMYAFVASVGPEGPTRRFAYTMLSGAAGVSTLQQMVQHVVNHGTYHRGQVTTMLRQLGAQPAKSMDMIAFYRERSNTGIAG